ncbi:uncharacterized protein At5g03900, chloroplastic-like [Argentina anserina]|uniref:uncharacterized protein At5g03900, chloroplastic-like n=1 Tax=Argentina anserina TaxID=57926 RepID=UPI002176616D|nr:uncharacterized protein At5g03900, chloroplastic-like [Potentilla anserina]
MEAVDGSGRRVTVGDVAGRAGLQLTEAEKALQALASDAHGFLEVSDEGDVLYVFPKDLVEQELDRTFQRDKSDREKATTVVKITHLLYKALC